MSFYVILLKITVFPKKKITRLLLDHLDSCWTPSELLGLLFYYKTSGLQGLRMESPEFVRTPSGLLVESGIKFGWGLSQKIVHLDSIWTVPLRRSPSGVHQESGGEGKDLGINDNIDSAMNAEDERPTILAATTPLE
ncbi:hypothetical protein BDZ97DRAFT_1757752 [Flammula alnicola]|nr:hypothetical protein BDZ97DRAFT_1757752 [Flammula alnicola]